MLVGSVTFERCLHWAQYCDAEGIYVALAVELEAKICCHC